MKSNSIALWTKNWLVKNNLEHSFFEETTSTNDLAKKKAFNQVSKSHIFLTSKQKKGRGQKSNTWLNSDLMITWAWDGVCLPIHPQLSVDFSLDLLQSIQKVWPHLDWKIKEPNDIYLENKKVAGILLEILEQSSQKSFVLGLGFNVFSHPENLPATHLSSHTQDISEEKWEIFLKELHTVWNKRVLKI